MPAGPAAVERAVYRGYDEVASGVAAAFETWEVFQLHESELRDGGDSVLWLGRVEMRGRTSGVELDQEFAVHNVVRDGKITQIHTFLSWREGLEAAGLTD
jgi:ketosteroid isomerase-like protein